MKKILTSVALAAVLFLLPQCTIREDLEVLKGSLDSLQIIVSNPEFKTMVHADFLDSKTLENVMNHEIEIKIGGKDAAHVYSNIGSKETSYNAFHGFLDLVINPNAVDTTAMKTTPLEIDLIVSSEGYLSTTQRILIYEARRYSVAVMMTNVDDAPEGVTVSQNSNFAMTTSTGQTILPSVQPMNGGEQTVIIPAGVVLKDAAGNPVTGTVKSEIVFYDPLSESAQNAFPGGTSVSASLPDGSEGQIEFVSAGMFTVSLSAGDQKVKTFENGGITLKTEVSPDLINPNTGVAIKVGDEIEMWSKEEESGEWVYEKTATVKTEGGKLYLEETVTHLSSWNWDFYYNACSYGPKFLWRGNVEGAWGRLSSQINSSGYRKSRDVYINTNSYWDNHTQLYNTPSNQPTTFWFESSSWYKRSTLSFSPSTLQVSNLCAGETFIIDVTETKTPVEEVTIKFDLSASSASNSQIVVRPNAYLYYYSSAAMYWQSFNLIAGKANFNLELGSEYYLYGYMGNFWGSGILRIDKVGSDKLRVTMNPTISFGSSSATNPVSYEIDRPADNIVEIKYNAVLPDQIMNMFS